METSDFTLITIRWTTGVNLDKQYQDVRTRIEGHKPDCVVIVGIPRHHAKKIGQQDWTKDYFQSKERRNVTESRSTRICSVVYSRYPFTSEEWISEDTNKSIAHIAEICVPIGAWKIHRSPIELLQEIQIGYDEVSTLTIIVTVDPDSADAPESKLKQAFSVDRIKNTVIFVSAINTEVQELWWKIGSAKSDVVCLISNPTI